MYYARRKTFLVRKLKNELEKCKQGELEKCKQREKEGEETPESKAKKG
jgi:hypothetical protein